MSNRFKVKVPVGKISRNMERDHLDVLQNIELAIVKAFDEFEAVDDSAVREALVALLNDREPGGQADGQPAHAVWINLSAVRRLRNDVLEATWRDGLRVVLHSVRNHSACRPGETAYLDFVSLFVA